MAGTRVFFAVVGADGGLTSVTVNEAYDKTRSLLGTPWPEFTVNGRKIVINTALVAYVEPEAPAPPVAEARPFRVKV
jgi:hypothetical protein